MSIPAGQEITARVGAVGVVAVVGISRLVRVRLHVTVAGRPRRRAEAVVRVRAITVGVTRAVSDPKRTVLVRM